jgi:hypothetical protein
MSVLVTVTSRPAPPAGPSVEALISVTENLTALIQREIEVLTAEGPRNITAFQEEKSRLSQAYAREMAQVRAHPEQMSALPPETLQHLKSITDRFRSTLRMHLVTVERVKSVTETVLKAIGKHVAERTRPVIGYGQDRNARLANARAPISLAFDQAV